MRQMFDEIYAVCLGHDLTMTLWVDNLTISGKSISGSLLAEVRKVIAKNGMRSHQVEFRHSKRPVGITGLWISAGSVQPPNSVHLRVRDLEKALRLARDPDSYAATANELLSALGTKRHIVGNSTPEGRRITDRMHTVRQKKAALFTGV